MTFPKYRAIFKIGTGAAAAAFRKGNETTLALIEALGGSGAAGPDSLEIYGKDRLPGGVCDSCGDHRIAMSAAIASLLCTGPVTLRGAQAVEKSYPAFWQAFASLGGQIAWEEEA